MKDYLVKAIEEGDTYKFYRSIEWINKRRGILERDNFECQMCKEEGRVSKGNVVHHIKHLKHRVDLALVHSNLITLCFFHHNVVHPEKLSKGNEAKFTTHERW